MPFLLRVLISALLVAAISEVARRSSLLGALLASLPLTSLLAMVWLWRDTHDPARLAQFSTGVFWLVLPSLVFFALLPPLLLRWRVPFPWALALASGATVVAYLLTMAVLRRFGIHL